jgi:hypothetical protein
MSILGSLGAWRDAWSGCPTVRGTPSFLKDRGPLFRVSTMIRSPGPAESLATPAAWRPLRLGDRIKAFLGQGLGQNSHRFSPIHWHVADKTPELPPSDSAITAFSVKAARGRLRAKTANAASDRDGQTGARKAKQPPPTPSCHLQKWPTPPMAETAKPAHERQSSLHPTTGCLPTQPPTPTRRSRPTPDSKVDIGAAWFIRRHACSPST